MINKTHPRLMRLSEVLDLYPVSRSTLYKQINLGLFPKPIHVSDRSVAWVESELEAILLAKIQSYETDKMKQLVEMLENERNST